MAISSNEMSCLFPGHGGCTTSSPGFTYITWKASSAEPKPATLDWYKYHWFNRVTVANPAYSATGGCLPYEMIQFGPFFGSFGGGPTKNNELMYVYQTAEIGGRCNVIDTTINVGAPGGGYVGSICLRLWKNGGYIDGDYWDSYAGYFINVLHRPVRWSTMSDVDAGQQIWANSGAGAHLADMQVPVNFLDHLQVQGTGNPSLIPWHDLVFAGALYGKTHQLPQPWSPLVPMFLMEKDFTQMTTHYLH